MPKNGSVMNRFQFKLQRLTLFGLFVVFALIAINPVLRWAIVRAGRAVTGAGVEVDRVQASLLSGQVAISGFRAVDPQHRGRNLFDVGRVVLHLDRSRLLHRQFLVTRAEVSDLQLASERATGSALTESASADYLAAIGDRYARLGRDWLETTDEQLNASAPFELTSVALADDLLQRWPNELDELEQRAIVLRSDLVELNRRLKATGDNPLRNAQHYQAAIRDIEQKAQQLAEVESDVNRVEQQILMDQDEINLARENDLQSVDQPAAVSAIRPDSLTEYLLGHEVSDNIVSIIYWMRWGRQFLPTLSQEHPAALNRGQDTFFDGITPDATIVINDLLLRGAHGGGSGVQYDFEGRIQGLSSSPALSHSAHHIRRANDDLHTVPHRSHHACGRS